MKKIVTDFIWNCKKDLIAYITLFQTIPEGGLKWKQKTLVLKLAWIKRLCDNTEFKRKAGPKNAYNANNLPKYLKKNNPQ